MNLVRVLCGLAVLVPQIAFAATGKPDFGNYVGSDTLNPAPKLPTTGPNSFLAITDVSSGFTHTAVTLNPTAGDDQTYSIDLSGAALYGTPLSNCRASDNGYIACQDGTPLSFFDNVALPDRRFGDRIVIAPYFDDLAPIAGTSAIDVYKSATTAIVQWTSYTIVGKPTARLTFRVVFTFSASNNDAVEFQYLEMTNGADGSSATIGLQRADASAWNQYTFNTAGAITMGTAGATALQAILFDFDSDGDRVNDAFETAIGTDPLEHDTDTGGLDDGAELALGKDPTDSGDDGANTDTDGDGITNASEMFYGTDPTKVDTDGDSTAGTSLKDNEELYTLHLDPARNDTDLDGYADGAEIDAATDPLDPNSFPSLDLKVSGAGKMSPRSTLDGNGMLHVVALANNSTGLFYWMVDPAGGGTIKIPETFIKLPRTPADPRLRSPSVHAFGGKVYVTYELVDKGNSTSVIGFARINPANAPQDGNPVAPASIVEVSTTFAPTTGAPRQHDMAVDANGVHLAYVLNPTAQDRQQARLGMGYARLSYDGVAQQQVLLPLPSRNNNVGVHKRSCASIALGPDGTAHLVFLGTTKRSGASSIVWSTIKGGEVSTYDIPLKTPMVFNSAAMKGSLLYVFGSGGRSASAQMMVIDTANITSSPVVGDYWLAPRRIDPGSLLVSPSAVAAGGGRGANTAAVTVLANGTAIGYYSHGKNGSPKHDVCLAAFLNNGAPSGAPYCVPGADNSDGYHNDFNNDKHGARRIDFNPLADGSMVFVYNSSNAPASVTFRHLSLAPFQFPATLPTINTPPRITSTPPAGALRVGSSYSYAATATDTETPNALTWSLSAPPQGMTVSTSGVVTWTPSAGQVGTQTTALQVCDGGSPSRCVSQLLQLTIAASSAPVFVSAPPTSALANQSYAYQAVVDDPQSGAITYALTAPSPAPGNMALGSTGLLTWTPTAKDVGSTVVTITATDAAGLSATQTFTLLTSVPMSIDPQFTSVPATTAVVGSSYVYNVTATDPGDPGATFTYALTSTASGNMALSQSGALSWKPTSKEKGTQAITIQATSSSGRTATQSFAVTVVDAGGGGCSCDIGGRGDGASWSMLLLVGLLLMLVRRRRA